MSSNPASVNYRNPDLVAGGGSERAVVNAANSAKAQEASTGDAGVAEGDKAKRAVQADPKGV